MTELKRFADPDFHDFRWYIWGDDAPSNWYISVTAVLGNVVHKKLLDWIRNKSGASQKKTLERRSDEGTRLHDVIEADLLDKEFTLDEDNKAAYHQWLTLKEKHHIIGERTEISLTHPDYGYGGTFDIIGEFEGKRAIMDIKSGRFQVKAIWQLAAYREAYMKMTGETDIGMVGIQVKQDGSEARTFKYEHYDFCWNRFLDALGCFRGLYYPELNKRQWRWLHNEPRLQKQK